MSIISLPCRYPFSSSIHACFSINHPPQEKQTTPFYTPTFFPHTKKTNIKNTLTQDSGDLRLHMVTKHADADESTIVALKAPRGIRPFVRDLVRPEVNKNHWGKSVRKWWERHRYYPFYDFSVLFSFVCWCAYGCCYGCCCCCCCCCRCQTWCILKLQPNNSTGDLCSKNSDIASIFKQTIWYCFMLCAYICNIKWYIAYDTTRNTY